jgi:hypothetical protein
MIAAALSVAIMAALLALVCWLAAKARRAGWTR